MGGLQLGAPRAPRRSRSQRCGASQIEAERLGPSLGGGISLMRDRALVLLGGLNPSAGRRAHPLRRVVRHLAMGAPDEAMAHGQHARIFHAIPESTDMRPVRATLHARLDSSRSASDVGARFGCLALGHPRDCPGHRVTAARPARLRQSARISRCSPDPSSTASLAWRARCPPGGPGSASSKKNAAAARLSCSWWVSRVRGRARLRGAHRGRA